MPQMTKFERVDAVVSGQQPDRPPVSFWHHFSSEQRAGTAAVRAHLDFLKTNDIDFLKVMYDLGYPPPATPIRRAADLSTLTVLDGNTGPFGIHLETIRTLAGELNGKVKFATTVFNAWATLRRLLLTEEYVPGAGPSPVATPLNTRVAEIVAEDRNAVKSALAVIGRSLSNFAKKCIEAGADGVFLSVRDDWVDTPANGEGTYDDLVRASDAEILGGAAEGSFNVLHVCGAAKNFDAFAKYPVHVINWADRTAGPTIPEVVGALTPAICGGLNHVDTIPGTSEQRCADEVCEAVALAGERPIIIGPGCTYDPDRVPQANLAAIRRAVDEL